MKIVIELTDEMYANVQAEVEMSIHPSRDARWTRLLLAICNGEVLPKGHGRLIDADELLRYIDSMQSWLNENGYRVIRRIRLTEYIQDSLPTIIEADKEAAEEVDE